MEYKDRSLVLFLIGALLLLVGLGCAFLGPVEIYCFYLFSEGGPFYYEGFGFGSFMFGNLALQIAGYYVIALLCIPLGYGHLRRRCWTRTLTLTLLWSWLVVGVPLTIVFLLILFSSKDLSLPLALLVVVCLALSYPLLPALLIRFYRGRNVRGTFEAQDPNSYWIERVSMPNLVLGFLFLLYAILLHLPILFNGMFPLFGTWLSGLPGVVALTIAILGLVFLAWGVLRQRIWAWWASLVFFGLLIISFVLTLVLTTWSRILTTANFPPFEMEILAGIPIQGWHLAIFVGLPLMLTWGLILFSRRSFERRYLERRSSRTAEPGPDPPQQPIDHDPAPSTP